MCLLIESQVILIVRMMCVRFRIAANLVWEEARSCNFRQLKGIIAAQVSHKYIIYFLK